MAPDIPDTSPPGSSRPTPWWRRLSAGIITGAADDDPSGVATYTQVGAKFGFTPLWTTLLSLPLMIAIQMVSAQIGRVTGKGLGDCFRGAFPRPVVGGIMVLLAVANVINIAADVAAMGAAVQLLFGGPAAWYGLLLAVASLALQVWLPFERYASVLKVLTLSIFAYVGTAFIVEVPWGQALGHLVVPRVNWSGDFAIAVTAILGTTISPYLFAWQAAQEVEEIHTHADRDPLVDAPEQAADAERRIRIDTVAGMVFSNLVAFFIMLTAAAVLYRPGGREIESAAQAASALEPVAGRFASYLFSAGIIGTGLLALPVLAGSTAYGLCGAWGKRYGLGRSFGKARFFYGVLIACMLAGAALNFTPVNPIKALYWSAVVNGVCAVPMMAMIMLIASRRSVMEKQVIGPWLKTGGWLATTLMAVAAVAMLIGMAV